MDNESLVSIDIGKDELETIRRSLCFLTATGSREYREEFVDHIVLHSLAQLPMGSRSVADVRNKLLALLKIPLEHEQVLDALWRLKDKDIIYTSADRNDSNPMFGLIPEQIKKIRAQVKQQEEFEEKVLCEWEDEIKEKFQWVEVDDLRGLREDLIKFSHVLYSIHSIESASVFYGDNKDIKDFLDQVDRIGIKDILPDRGKKLDSIRMSVLSEFFFSQDVDRKAYVGSHLNPVFALSMMRLDPKSAKFVSKEFLGGTLILDTNVLFRLFGMDGPDLQDATIRLLNLSRGLNYRPVVTPRTIEEYLRSLSFRGKPGQSNVNISVQVAETALKVTRGRSIDTELWKKIVETKGRISVEEYFHLYHNIDGLLKQFNVEVFEERDAYIRSQTKALTEEGRKMVEALGWTSYDDLVIEHDAYHRLLILDLRQGAEDASPLETRYWFLTCDSKLDAYDRKVRQWERHKQELNVPFCIKTSQWLQILSPYRAAVEGFEIAQFEHLDSPLFRLFHSPKPGIVDSIITRLSHDGFSAEFTASMIANENFLVEFEEAKSNEKREEVYIKHTGNEYEKLKEEKDQLEQRFEQIMQRIEILENDNISKTLETTDLAKQKQEADEMAEFLLNEFDSFKKRTEGFEELQLEHEINQETIEQLTTTVRELQTSTEVALTERLKAELASAKAQNRQLIRYFAAAIIFLLGGLALLYLNYVLEWPWFQNHPHRLGLTVTMIGSLISICLLIGHDKFRTWGTGGFLVSLLAVIPQIIDSNP